MKLTLRKKLILAITLMVAIFAILITLLLKTNYDAEKSFSDNLGPVVSLNHLNLKVLEVPYRMYGYLADILPAASNLNALKEEKKVVQKYWTIFMKNFEKNHPKELFHPKTQDKKKGEIALQYAMMKKTMAEFLKLLNILEELYNKDARESVEEVVEEDWPDIQVDLFNTFAFFTKYYNQQGNTAQEQSAKSTQLNQNISITLSLIAMLVFGTIYIFGNRRIVNPLMRISDRLRTNSSVMSRLGNTLMENGNELDESSNKQAAATQQSVAALEEMKSMMEQTFDYIKQSQDLTNIVSEKSGAGNAIIQSLSHSMQRIETFSEQLSDISQIINDISSKTNVINDIVFKTQLLSFNASIEAARAGQHGKGFAVVAEEVGNLAQMSGTAATEIKELLEESSNQVGKMVQSAQGTIKEGQDVSQQAVSIFGEITNDITKVESQFQGIVTATNEQKLGLEQTSTAMADLDQSSKKNNSLSTETKKFSEELYELKDDIQHLTEDMVSITSGDYKKNGR